MRLKYLIIFSLSVVSTLFSISPTQAKEQVAPSTGVIVENTGQIKDQFGNTRKDIDFRLVGKGVTMFVGSGHLYYQWSAASTHPNDIQMYRMDVNFLGSNSRAHPNGVEMSYTENYYDGENKLTAKSYSRIVYADIYPNIDWVLYIKNGIPEYDFILHPGADVSSIRMQYQGSTGLNLNEAGELTATTPMGYITEHTPVAYKKDGSQVIARFDVAGSNVGFITQPYNGELTIDPTISWGTYFGGSLYDAANQITADDSGNVYIAGSTASIANIATTGSFQTTYSGGTGGANYLGDAFLTKFNSTGQCLWATYYGGSGIDFGHGVAIDTAHNIYLAGTTNSNSNIATIGSYQATFGGNYDAYVAKFTPAGNRLWATYFGGTGTENAAPVSISCDTSGRIYVSGSTNSATAVATSGTHQTSISGSNDAFLAKFNPNCTLQWGTYFGGSSSDLNYRVTCAIDGGVYIGGQTPSTSNITTSGTHQATYGGGANDAYLAKFSTNGQRIWSTYFGGPGFDRLTSILPDKYGNIYISGITSSTSNISSTGSHQGTHGGSDDIFLGKFNSTGNRIWATYYGSSGAEGIGAASMAFDALERVYFCGRTNSTTTIATTGSIQPGIGGSYDGLLVKFDTAGTRIWGSYLGGVDVDFISSIASKGNGTIYLTGESNSGTNISTTGAFQTTFGGGNGDAFIIKIADCDTPSIPASISGPTTVCKGQSYQFTTPVVAGIGSYTWSFPSDWSFIANGNTVDVIVGALTGGVTVTANNSCASSIPQALALTIEVVASITPSGVQAFCANDSLLLTATSGSGFTYQWMKNGTHIIGANSSQYYAKTAGEYAVIVSNSNCTDTSLSDTIVVNPLPVPTIQDVNGDLVAENYYVTYQWNYEGNSITGATQNSYTANIDGHYTVSVTDTNGCVATSSIFTKGFPVSVSSSAYTPNLSIFPNPATTSFSIAGAVGTVEILTVDGRSVYTEMKSNNIDVSQFARGLYILQVTSEGVLIGTCKLILQ